MSGAASSVSQLHEAVKRNDLALVKAALTAGVDIDEVNAVSAVVHDAYGCSNSFVLLFLSRQFGDTALHVATKLLFIDLMRFILNSDAAVDSVDAVGVYQPYLRCFLRFVFVCEQPPKVCFVSYVTLCRKATHHFISLLELAAWMQCHFCCPGRLIPRRRMEMT